MCDFLVVPVVDCPDPLRCVLGILVRDEAAREKLRGEVGDIGLIMYENVHVFLLKIIDVRFSAGLSMKAKVSSSTTFVFLTLSGCRS